MSAKGRRLHTTRATAAPLADLPAAERIAETRRLLEALGGPVYDRAELEAEYRVENVICYVAYVVRRSDGVRGTLQFHAAAGLFYGWRAGR
jgi:hypothetical protein